MVTNKSGRNNKHKFQVFDFCEILLFLLPFQNNGKIINMKSIFQVPPINHASF